ncbi:MAG: hypothetical protein HFE73_09025 [Firmicutes bacterium]|jgi:hypothetical protein|nr:hypothetical protein [Bacillota bacterium]
MKPWTKGKLSVLVLVFFALAASCWLSPSKETSDSERRALAQWPELSAETVLDGTFMDEFETYAQDQFPGREKFRSLKALAEYGIFFKKDQHDIYVKDGYAAQILYPLNENSVKNAAERFRTVYETYLEKSESKGRIFAAVIPDKGYFMAEKYGYPALDYDRLAELLKEDMDYATHINLTDTLALEDYYRTDSHWRQEQIYKVAGVLGEAMGLERAGKSEMEAVIGLTDFRGVYYGQSALPLAGEALVWLTNDVIENCQAYNFETNETTGVYQTEKLEAKDPYDVFLGGAAALITVENPTAQAEGNHRELILFRDSFGSSLAPLLLEDYGTVTLVDLRYVQAAYLEQLIDFHGQDVLFLYGAAMLNDSFTLK